MIVIVRLELWLLVALQWCFECANSFVLLTNVKQIDIEIDGVLILVRLGHCLLVLSLLAVVRGQCRQCFGVP